jgi:hypothetical protein
MNKSKEFHGIHFAVETVQAAVQRLTEERLAAEGKEANATSLRVDVDGSTWTHEGLAEFWADVRRGGAYHLQIYGSTDLRKTLEVSFYPRTRRTEISINGPDRAWIEGLYEIFEAGLTSAEILVEHRDISAPPPRPSVFIGHGRNPMWRDLQDHLRDQHGFEVVAFESGARAGHVVRDILDDMTARSSIAFLVLTGDDEAEDGKRARQNVVHELGLCQGKLGFSRGIALIEAGVQPFSNLDGIQQIRFGNGNIRETFGDVLATIRREFPEPAS